MNTYLTGNVFTPGSEEFEKGFVHVQSGSYLNYFNKEESVTVVDCTGPGILVVPGLVDLHVHVYHDATVLGVEPDRSCLERYGKEKCVTLHEMSKGCDYSCGWGQRRLYDLRWPQEVCDGAQRHPGAGLAPHCMSWPGWCWLQWTCLGGWGRSGQHQCTQGVKYGLYLWSFVATLCRLINVLK